MHNVYLLMLMLIMIMVLVMLGPSAPKGVRIYRVGAPPAVSQLASDALALQFRLLCDGLLSAC
jgi:hypothetical protein